jgi:hypothetical protein
MIEDGGSVFTDKKGNILCPRCGSGRGYWGSGEVLCYDCRVNEARTVGFVETIGSWNLLIEGSQWTRTT